MQKYFFDKDRFGRWFTIPAEQRLLWNTLNTADAHNDSFMDESFGKYRLDGDLKNFQFELGEKTSIV